MFYICMNPITTRGECHENFVHSQVWYVYKKK